MTVKNAFKGKVKFAFVEETTMPLKSFSETQTPVMGKTIKMLFEKDEMIAIAQTPLMDKTMKIGSYGGGPLLLKEEEAED